MRRAEIRAGLTGAPSEVEVALVRGAPNNLVRSPS